VIIRVRSGGQSGVDRAALDAAQSLGMKICGWCPKGGWAEDFPNPPGLLVKYPQLGETPSSDVNQRTEWNVRDADATVIFKGNGISAGTEWTRICVEKYKKPCFIISDNDQYEVFRWIKQQGRLQDINFAGPRESEETGIYDKAYTFIFNLLKLLEENG